MIEVGAAEGPKSPTGRKAGTTNELDVFDESLDVLVGEPTDESAATYGYSGLLKTGLYVEHTETISFHGADVPTLVRSQEGIRGETIYSFALYLPDETRTNLYRVNLAVAALGSGCDAEVLELGNQVLASVVPNPSYVAP